MNNPRWTSSVRPYCLPVLALAGLLGILSCREDVTSPRGPEPEAATAAVAQAPNTWISRAPIGDNHQFSVAAAVNAAGQWFAYTFGGRDDDRGVSRRTLRYNVQTDTWSSQDINSRVEAYDMNGVGKIGNKFYMTGGWQSCCTLDGGLWNALWVYDIGANTQTRKADMPRATRSGQTAVMDNKLYVLAGYCSGFSFDQGHCTTESPVRQFYRYDPVTNTWINRRQPPHIHANGAGAVIDGKFYVVGASPAYTTTSGRELDVYDPATNTWTSKAPIPTGGAAFTAAVIQNRMFVVVGGATIRAYSYDPVGNTWKSKAAPPVFQPIVRVQLDGQARLFLPGNESSYLYAP
jgi:N-acetylneuraminic acid mutarotase